MKKTVTCKKTRTFNDEKGAIMVTVAILISVLLAFTAIVIDAGMCYHDKNKLQTASDSVALAVASSVSKTEDYNPVKNATQAVSVKKEVQKMYVENGIEDYKYVSGDVASTNIQIYSIDRKDEILSQLEEKVEDIVCVFYKAVDATDTESGYRYIEIYAHSQTQSIFGNIFDIEFYNMSVSSAAKCDVVKSGNPEALNYQIINLNPDENFDITGPIEDTGLKTFLDITENLTNTGLDFLQNKTYLISKYIMGGKTAFTCPNCGTTQREIYFEATDPAGNVYYICPNCSTECTLDDSNKVGVNITTSAAVVNGYIHSNGGAHISIDTFRLRSFLDETEPIDSEIIKEDDYFTYYANGIKTSNRPILEISKGQEYLTIDGNNTNDMYFLGDPITTTNADGEPVSLYRTIYKAADSAKPWDASRVRKQFIYNADQIEDPGFLSYVSRRYTDLSQTDGNVNVGSVTKTTSGQSYNVDFAGECENGITWRFDASSGTLTVGGNSAIADYGSSVDTAPWLNAYRNEIKTVVIQEGITEIGMYAFYNCKNLSSVSLPSTLSSISYRAFLSCPISEITIPQSTTFINSSAFSLSSLKKVYGVENSYAQQWASQNGIEFSTDISTDDSTGAPTEVSKFDIISNAKSILEKIDLGNDKSLPNVYDVYDSYYNFDLDSDGMTESLEDVVSGNTTVTDIVTDKKNHISGTTSREDIRIQLDSIITSITGEVHSQNNVTATNTFEQEFDINVEKAVDTEDTLLNNELSNLEREYFETTTLDSGVSNTVSKYNTLLEQRIIEKINENSVTPENYLKTQAETYASTSGFDSETVNLYKSITGGDGDVSSRIISEKTAGFASVGKKNIDGVSYDDSNGTVSYEDGDGWYRVFNCSDGASVKYDTQNFDDDECGLIVSKSTDAYVDGYVHTGKKSSWFVTTYTNVVLNNGTATDPTTLYVGGSSKKSVNGVDAALDVSGSLILYPHSRLVVHGDIYIGRGNIHMWDDTVLICDGNIYVNGVDGNGIIAAASADSSRIYCSGNIVVNGDSDKTSSGIGPNGIILCGGSYSNPKADFYNNGIILTQSGFSSGKLNNTGSIFAETGNVYSTGFITNTASGVLYAKDGNVISDKDSVTNDGIIYAVGYLDCKTGNLNNNGRIYVGSYLNCFSLSNISSSAVIYAGGSVNLGANSTIYGWLCTGKMINANSNKLYIYGIVSTGGAPMDANGNEAADPVLASYIQGITADCVDVYNDAQLYVRGRVTCTVNGFAFLKSEDYLPASVKGFAMIDGGLATDGGYALSTKTYLKLINGSRLFVNGNVSIDEKDGVSVYSDANTYLNVSGTLVLKKTLPVVQGSLIHVGSLIVPNSMSCGVSEMTIEGSKQTGLIVDRDMTVTGDLALYGLTHIGMSLNVSGRITVDDNSQTFVGTDVIANDMYLWDYGNMFVCGNITLKSTADRVLYFAQDNSSNMLLCAGDVTSGKNIEVYDEGVLMSGGKTTAQSGYFYIYSAAIVYSKDDIVYNYADSTVENIMFTDSDIESLYSTGSILRVTSEDMIYYDNLINITVRVEILRPNTSTQINTSITHTPIDGSNLLLGESGKQLIINKGVTVYVVNADIYFTGDVINYGTIICYSGNLFKKGGNIYFTDGNEYTSLTNYGTIYCEKDMDIRGTNNGKTLGIWYHNGISLQNGNKSNQSPEIYVGGNLGCYAAVDNFGQIYVAGDVETTKKYNAKTYSAGQQSTGVGLDNENNSVFMAGGTVNTNNGKDERTSITVRSNSVFYGASNVKTSRNFIVGNAFLQGGTTSQDGAEQYAYMTSDAYKGLDNSVAGYQICTAVVPGAMKVVNDSNVGVGEISASEIEGIVYDQYGNKIDDITSVYGKYVIYTYTANGHDGSMVYDFGFAYIDGTLTTGTGSSNYVQPYGKSVLYVAGNPVHSADSYYNSKYGIETHHIFTFPYSRVYCGGNLKTYGGNSDSIALNEWFYTFMYIDGSAEFAGKVKMRDATTTIVNGPIKAGSYVEIGKAPDGDDEAIDEHNYAFVQCDGDFTAGGYIKIYARATLNSNGNISNGLNYITLRHHAAIRAAEDITCSQADIGSGSVVYAGKDFTALVSTMKIRDDCEVSVGGNGGGNLSALSYIEIGKHEDEQYKYNSWSENRKKNDSSLDYEVPDNGETGSGSVDVPTGDDSVNNDRITCPNCGEQGTIASGKFSSTVTDGVRNYKCARCATVFDDTADAFEDDDALGSTVYVNGTINSVTSYLKLFANTQAYATQSIRSFKYITLRHHAGLYVTTESPNAQGIMYDYDADSRLLDSSGNAVEGFFVDTDTSSSEYGSIFYYPAQVQRDDGSTVTRRLYGFTVQADYSESFTPDETKGTLYQNILYYYEDGEKVYYTKSTDVEVNGEIQQAVDYYGFENGALVLGSGDSLVGTQVNSREISLVVTEGSISSYGPLSVNTYAHVYSTGDIFSSGKTYIGDGAVVYAEGDYMCTKLISISSLIDGNSVCGFEMKHGALRTGGDIRIFSCSEIEGGTIDAIGDITFDSIYTNYDYDGSNAYTDEKDIDLFICSRNGDVNFHCLYSSTGGVTYAPNGKISADGVYFEHNGSFIAGDNDINCFYINLHRLDNLATLDLEWVSPDQVYLCEVEDAD